MVIADKAYSHPSTRQALRDRTIRFVSPERGDQIARRAARGSRGGRPPAFDAELYKQRNVIERCSNRLKQFRDLATRYAKRAAYYHAELTIATSFSGSDELQDTPSRGPVPGTSRVSDSRVRCQAPAVSPTAASGARHPWAVTVRAIADWETVREFALAFPEAQEDTSYSRPAFRVRGKLFAWMSPHEERALVVRVDPDEKQFLLESDPDTYFSTRHYEGYPAVLIRLERIERDQLAERIEDAWLLRAPKRLVNEFVADS